MLDKRYRALRLDDPKGARADYRPKRLYPPRSRYDIILRQRHVQVCSHALIAPIPPFSNFCVQLLGRTVDVHGILTQRLNLEVRTNLEELVSRFESQDLCEIQVCFLFPPTLRLAWHYSVTQSLVGI